MTLIFKIHFKKMNHISKKNHPIHLNSIHHISIQKRFIHKMIHFNAIMRNFTHVSEKVFFAKLNGLYFLVYFSQICVVFSKKNVLIALALPDVLLTITNIFWVLKGSRGAFRFFLRRSRLYRSSCQIIKF